MPATQSPDSLKSSVDVYYHYTDPVVVAAAPQKIVRGKKVGTDYGHRNCRTADVPLVKTPRLTKTARIERDALLAQVQMIQQIALGLETGFMAINRTDVYTKQWDGGKAWHNLGPKLCQLIGRMMMSSERWHGLNIAKKAVVADYVSPEWEFASWDYLHCSFPSFTEPGKFHQIEFVPQTGEVICNCGSKHPCSHVRLYNMRYREMVLSMWEAANPGDSCAIARSEFTQGMDESHIANSVRVDKNRDTLIKPDEDFDTLPAPYVPNKI